MARRQPRRARRRLPGGASPVRWLLVAGALLIVFLYYRPLRTYVQTRDTLAHRSAEVRSLEVQKRLLEQQLSSSSTDASLVRQARRLGLVRPDERLFIVKGIPAWRGTRQARGG